jgi:hypothetical protein
LSPNAAGLNVSKKGPVCGKVDELRLGDRVRFRGSEFVARGLSPRSVVPGRVILENPATGERIQVWIDDLANTSSGAEEDAERSAGMSSETP